MELIIRDYRELARFCRDLREQNRMTQQELADAIGLSSLQLVSGAESESQPSRQKPRKQILAYFGYEVQEAYIVREKEKEKAP